MAERRMFAKTVIDSDGFLDMPLSAQALYFHLAMRADDDGFVNNPRKIQRMIGANDDDIRVLIAKQFIITFNTGVIVISHWRIHNYIQKDRYKETLCTAEKSMLSIDGRNMYTSCIQNVSSTDTQVSIGKVSIGKDNIYSPESANETAADTAVFTEIIEYLNRQAGTNYRASSTNTKKHIHARLADGYSVEDFKTVIDKKCNEWLGTDYAQYLRPDTLFGSKFEAYLNAPAKPKRGANGVAIAEKPLTDLDDLF